ncbi:MAG: methyl-accepting chemotaxis protein, partial [Schwartzia sp.]|nr:methyl-accepting chemotaxis protein [Schwartzia sp. (in: firmicutes)]
MGVRQKFFLLSGVAGIIMAVVAVVGYFTAANSLKAAVEEEIVSEIGRQSAQADGWLAEKGKYAEGVAAQLSKMGAKEDALAKNKNMMAAVANDKEVLDLVNVMTDGYAMGWSAGDLTGKADWTKRPWYVDAKKAGKLIFTDPYKDVTTGSMVITAAIPYQRPGAAEGALCEDIKIDALIGQAKAIKYKGQGKGMIVNPASGIIIASANEEENLKQAGDNPYLKEHMAEMANNKKGYFISTAGGESKVIAYDRIPTTGWLALVSVPEDFVFAQLNTLRITYGAVTIVGVILVTVALLFFSNNIVSQVVTLTTHMNEMAGGNLRQEPLEVKSNDEFGQLATGFNSMNKNIRGLISQMAQSAQQVAASSQELTASSQQAAEAATHVAQTVIEVASGTEKQLGSVDTAKQSIDAAFIDINAMTEKAATVTENTEQMAGAADHGAELMQNAMEKMGGIEQSVSNSAEVVKKLGENSKQIGQIVESISAIADQTNL